MSLWGRKPTPPPRSADTDADRLLRTVRKLMAMIVAADGKVENAELEAFCRAYQKVSGKPLSIADAKNEVRLTDGDTNIERFLTKLKDKLDADDRKTLLRAAFEVASADGEVADAEDALLERVVRALGMSEAEAKAAIES
jgi:uncharacterized tellurite resistance protein B-like protein